MPFVRGTVVGMKFDWYLFIGSLFLLVFIVTRWVDSSFWNGIGVGLGLVSILALGVGISHLRSNKVRDEKA